MDEIDHDFQVQHFEAMVAADDRDGASEPLLEKLQFALMRRQFDVGVLHASLRSKCGGDRTLKCSHVPIVGHLNTNYGNTSASQLWEHSRAPTRGTPRVAWASGTETKKI